MTETWGMLSRAKNWLQLCILPMVLMTQSAYAEWELNMPVGVTDISQNIFELHMLIFWWCVGIGIVVFGVMIYSMFAHRKSKGAVAADFHESTKLEFLWTIVPMLILIAMAVPSTSTLIEIYDTSEEDMTIHIRGYQWKWQYKYLNDNMEEDVSFFSQLRTDTDEIHNLDPKGEHYLLEVDEPMVIPINKKVKFLLDSADVIHAWWVPAFAVKRDAIPGTINEIWTKVNEPGIYRGQCAELCGKDHGFMPIVVHAVEQADYDKWYAGKLAEAQQLKAILKEDWSQEKLMAKGEQVYVKNCAACHQANGAGIPPAFPALAGSPIALGDIKDHIDIVINGKAGTAMAAYGVQLNPVDLAAVITYERNAWGNNMGDMVSPQEILQLKAQ